MMALGRLWWKDTRQFWPIWAFLVFAAAVTQWLALRYAAENARAGVLLAGAFGWASLYAFAVAAAAFAGERESGTLDFLDMIPVSRRALWGGKASFALASTLALILLLLALAATGTDRWDEQNLGTRWVVLAYGAVLFEAIGWGLFWSSRLSNALTAAVASIVCTGFAAVMLTQLSSYVPEGLVASIPWRIGLAAVTTLASARAVIAPPVPRGQRWAGLKVKLRSPVQITATPRHAAVRAPRTSRPRGRAVLPLVWQTVREGRGAYAWLALLFVGTWFLVMISSRNAVDPTILFVSAGGVSVGCGLCAFNLENRKSTQRFLSNHGARPGVVWGVKLTVWSAGMMLLLVPLILLSVFGGTRAEFGLFVVTLFVFDGFFVGQFCGMVIKRGITAWVVSLVLLFLVATPQAALIASMMIPVAGLLLVPAFLLAITWAWSGDWLNERPAPGRWVRLGALTTSAVAAVLVLYIGSRLAISTGPALAGPAAWTSWTAEDEANNAADVYRKAEQSLQFTDAAAWSNAQLALTGSLKPEFQESLKTHLKANATALALAKEAAAMPRARFARPEDMKVSRTVSPPNMYNLAALIGLEATDRRSCGDLAGAWDDVLLIFRVSRHLTYGSDGWQRAQSNLVEQVALTAALAWVSDPKVTPELLARAQSDYDALPKAAPLADTFRAEANEYERLIDMPADRLADVLADVNSQGRPRAFAEQFWADAMNTPWERVRARAVFRNMFEAAVIDAGRDAYARPVRRGYNRLDKILTAGLPGASDDIDYQIASTPIARILAPAIEEFFLADERLEAFRRALPEIFALRRWQLTHGGNYPEHPSKLVEAGLLSSLPVDPLSGREFGYTESHGGEYPTLEESVFWTTDPSRPVRTSWGRRVLFSAGRSGLTAQAVATTGIRGWARDAAVMVLPLAPGQKERAQPEVHFSREMAQPEDFSWPAGPHGLAPPPLPPASDPRF